MTKQKKSRGRTPVSPRLVEPEMGAAFPEPCSWPLAWHGEALYCRPINQQQAASSKQQSAISNQQSAFRSARNFADD